MPAHGPYPVGVRTVTFVDTSRATPANGSAAPRASRTLVTTIVYPSVGHAAAQAERDAMPDRQHGPYPLVVFAHGFRSDAPTYEFVLARWAAAGYVVAAPTFPLSNGAAPGGPQVGDYLNQPADVSFVITRMLALDRQAHDWLSGDIDPAEVGIAGHSLGAGTVEGLAENVCCTDHRVKAAVVISGLELPFPPHDWQLVHRGPPLLLIHGDADRTVGYLAGVRLFLDASAPKMLMTILGGSHIPFFGASGVAIDRSVVDFFDAYLRHEPGSLQALARDANVPGVSAFRAQLR